MTSYQKRHFTLIELLVVIAIIAVLASMLLPALQRAKATAKEIACRGNLKTQGSAFVMYCDDYGGYFPSKLTTSFPRWYTMVLNYEKGSSSSQSLYCPIDPNLERGMTMNTLWDHGRVSYGMNLYYLHRHKAAEVTNPAETVLLCENAVDLSTWLSGFFHVWAWKDSANPIAYPRHGNKCGVSWNDGHVSPAISSTWQGLYADNVLGHRWSADQADNHWDR